MADIILRNDDKSIKLTTQQKTINLKHTSAPVINEPIDYSDLINKPDLSVYATKVYVDTSLAGKAEIVHVHTISDVTGLQAALNGKADTVHSHVASDVTDFDSEVSINADVSANTAARHTHANKAVLDATSASYTTADETKLDGIEAGAEVNTVTSVNTRTGAVTGLAEASDLTAHTGNTSNPHSVTKAQVGLGNVSNLAPADMPVSTAQQTALDGKANFPSTDSHVPVRDGSGAQSSLRYTSGTTGYTIGFRTADGQIGVGAPTDNTHATNKGYVDTALNAKANASDTVNLTGNQTIAGVKTFSSSPIVPTATTNTQAVNKAQMDAADATKVNKAGDTMTGKLIIATTSVNTILGASTDVIGEANIDVTHFGTSSDINRMKINHYSRNSAGTMLLNSQIQARLSTTTAGAEVSQFAIQGYTAGVYGVVFNIDYGNIYNVGSISPRTNLYYSVGSTANYWANVYANKLFLNSTATLDGSTAGEIKGTGVFTADNIKRGTGFPEGVVTANVGTIYVDTAITNGASSWIKKSGTGNTGWQVLEGDTGWVNVNNLFLFGTSDKNLLIRRVGTHVWLTMDRLMLTETIPMSTTFFTIPDGFKPSSLLPIRVGGGATYEFGSPVYSASGGLLSREAVGTGSRRFWLDWPTPEPWPTTLTF